MAQQQLDGTNVDAALQQMGSEAMAQRVATDTVDKTRTLSGIADGPRNEPGSTWWRPMSPVFGSRDRCRDANKNCQPNSWAAHGYFRASASGSATRARPAATSLLVELSPPDQLSVHVRPQSFRQHHHAVLAALAVPDHDLIATDIDVMHAQPTTLLAAQARPV